jgi:hypothetical protein
MLKLTREIDRLQRGRAAAVVESHYRNESERNLRQPRRLRLEGRSTVAL